MLRANFPRIWISISRRSSSVTGSATSRRPVSIIWAGSSSRTLLSGLVFTNGMTTAGRSGIASLAVLAITAVSPGAGTVTAAGSPWSPAARMVQPHQAAAATLLPNGKVLVVGSFPQNDTGAELYDPAADRWSPTGPMIVPRALGTATLLPSGKVLITGGITADTGHSTTRTELYDPAANSWFAGESMAVQRNSPIA